jgi:hypothetical protein
MNTEKVAIIHTGFHKTGSSSVQHSLANNRKLLEEYGYYYPDIRIQSVRFYNRSVPLYGRYCDQPEKFQHYSYHNELDAGFANRKIDQIFERDLWGKTKLVLSDEFVSTLTHSELTRLRDDFKEHGFKLRVISFIREPFNSIVSVAQQRVRRSSLMKTLSSDRPIRNAEKISAIISVFESDAEFYSFEKACQNNAGPVGFFFSLLGINLPVEDTLRVNEGMSDQSVRLLSFINSAAPQLDGDKRVNPIRRKFDVLPLSKIQGDKFKLAPDELAIVEPIVLKAREAIAEILGDDFLPPVAFSQSDKAEWTCQQLSYLLGISGRLDLHLLLRVNDFLAELHLEDESACSLREQLSSHIRERLDKELSMSVSIFTALEESARASKPAKYIRAVLLGYRWPWERR